MTSLFQALGLWGKSEKAGERGKDERGRRRAKEREPVRISLTAGIAGAAIPSDWLILTGNADIARSARAIFVN